MVQHFDKRLRCLSRHIEKEPKWMSSKWLGWWVITFLLILIPKLLKFIIFGIITLFYQILMYNIGVS